MHRYRYGHRVGFSNAEGLPSFIGEGLSCKNGGAAVSGFTIIMNWAEQTIIVSARSAPFISAQFAMETGTCAAYGPELRVTLQIFHLCGAAFPSVILAVTPAQTAALP